MKPQIDASECNMRNIRSIQEIQTSEIIISWRKYYTRHQPNLLQSNAHHTYINISYFNGALSMHVQNEHVHHTQAGRSNRWKMTITWFQYAAAPLFVASRSLCILVCNAKTNYYLRTLSSVESMPSQMMRSNHSVHSKLKSSNILYNI